MTAESTDVTMYQRQSLNAPLLLDDTKVVEKYIPSSSSSFNNDSRMRASILSIFDFLAPINATTNDDNTTEESLQSNNSSGQPNMVIGSANVLHHTRSDHNEDDDERRLSNCNI